MRVLYSLGVPLLAVFTALVLGAVIMAATGGDILKAYQGLWEGSLGRPQSISETLIWTTPYIFGGLAVAFAFKAGLFNIGVEGQISLGALASVYVGYAVKDVPFPLHAILAIVVGAAAGALWGAIPGFLKAKTGAHEVIVTIMLNYVAIQMTSFLVSGFMKDPNPLIANAQTPKILQSARLPPLLPDPQYRLHWGFVIAVLAAIFIWWLLNKSITRPGSASAMASTASRWPCSAVAIPSACCPQPYSSEVSRQAPRACSSCHKSPSTSSS